ncbi:hypothetical protein Q4601_10745 [Shewanella sp. 1_MG-2023]|uniref:hypothetical protein n=1 Tax=unclassified Shewanella TaxID=196818 RepID=UPI0026E3619A|nr:MULTISPECIES: hypothetical protein [unclassified Shewanella]MDO6613439.1 hypothetical protein [Shewanella sp. 7_MG-2023]MDO6770105.1 hypothetical protein [Shewanella sp. 2_MG-2023]MDO6794783.1 hypothetical protein [Shewanella sp. 1_MG-2023]
MRVNKFNQAKLGALTICLGVSLGMSIFVGSTSPYIGSMLGIITVGVFVMIVSGKWGTKST